MKQSAANEAEDLFWEGTGFPLSSVPNWEYTQKLLKSAALFREDKDFLAAGIATSVAITSTTKLGNFHFMVASEWSAQAIRDYAAFLGKVKEDSLGRILALMKSYQELHRLTSRISPNSLEVSRSRSLVMTSLAEEIVAKFCMSADHGRALVDGFRIDGPIRGPWDAASLGENKFYTHFESDTRNLSFRVDPAFELLIGTGDYGGAWRICQQFPEVFDTPGLKGWRAALEGFIKPKEAHRFFFMAADWFLQDNPKETDVPFAAAWVNYYTWEPHFRSRGYLALATLDEEKFEDSLEKAVKLAAKSKQNIPEVERFDLLIKTLWDLLQTKQGIASSDLRETFLQATFLDRQIYDSIILEFIDFAVGGLSELRRNRRKGLSKIGRALHALSRLPILGESAENAIAMAVDHQAIEILDGQTRNWIHTRLASLKTEDLLRKVLFQLFQNQIPKYAQIRHGPIEYGKDLVVVANEGGTTVLRMYQVKCGDITRNTWYNECRPQLEQIFQVPMCQLQIPIAVDRRLGVLIWNGHFSPQIEEIVQAWLFEQQSAFKREYQFMNLDGIVNYIIDNRLVHALRDILDKVSRE